MAPYNSSRRREPVDGELSSKRTRLHNGPYSRHQEIEPYHQRQHLQDQAKEKDRTITGLEARAKELEQIGIGLKKELKAKDAMLEEKDAVIAKLKSNHQELERDVVDARKASEEKDTIIAEWKSKNKELEDKVRDIQNDFEVKSTKLAEKDAELEG